MNFVSVFMAVFSIIGAADRIIGNKFGLGKEFEKGFMLFGNVALSMIGMIILAPFLGELMQPAAVWIYNTLHIDSSILPAMLFANDMGGAALSTATAQNETLGLFNGLVVSSMMGCTISFTIPVALSIVGPEKHKDVLTGFLCGIITIPVGCFVSGLIYGINIFVLLIDLLPLIILSLLVALGFVYIPELCIKIFGMLGTILKILITIGLALGIVEFLLGIELPFELDTLENGGMICLNACVVMSGAFPFLAIVSKIISKPLNLLSERLGTNKESVFGFFSSLATSVTTFKSMETMDSKGVVLNAAFAISGAFTFAGHLAFTLSMNADLVLYVILGKLISGMFAVIIASFVYKNRQFKEKVN